MSQSGFRCSAAAEERGDDPAGTASTVRAFLLLEEDGPWGVDALTDARFPEGLGATLQRAAARARVRALLIRRADRRDRGRRRVFAGYADPERPWLETAELADVRDVLDLDLAALRRGESVGLSRTDVPLIAACTQGRHDACCAERGRPVATALADHAPELSWEVSHIGGDRFAGNVLVLPHGLYYGRVAAETVPGLVEATREGRIDLDLVRGRSCWPMAVQAAEIAVRRREQASALSALRVVAVEGGPTDGTATEVQVDLECAGRPIRVRVRTRLDDTARWPLTCRAAGTSPVPVHEVEVLGSRPRP